MERQRIDQLLATAAPGTVYDSDTDDAVQARGRRRVRARPAGSRSARVMTLPGHELTRRTEAYVQADVDAQLAHALAAHLGTTDPGRPGMFAELARPVGSR
ncbi:hypothetical protein [Streptomyces sp. NK08204]|uniref:hypothetical protein n=1 Tax=Streptomyces sp. NK08204 TaxID=2873260 RepID=UPI001CEC6E55|nr:hypothetical protein [Streptomyces sp. NK08204]